MTETKTKAKLKNPNGEVITLNYFIGDEVYLKTDIDQNIRLVLEVIISPGQIMYQVCCGVEKKWVHDIELSDTKDYNKA